jgi:hypothetical protein
LYPIKIAANATKTMQTTDDLDLSSAGAATTGGQAASALELSEPAGLAGVFMGPPKKKVFQLV